MLMQPALLLGLRELLVKATVAICCLLGFAVNASASEALWKLVTQSHERAQSLSYTGTLVTRSGEHSQTSRIEHHATQEGEFELIEKLDGQPSRWIRHNDQIQCVIPERKLILSERRQINSTFPRVFTGPEGSSGLSLNYSIEELPSQRVAGRVVRVLKLMPKDSLRHEVRLFLDREHLLLLKTESYAKKGELLERVGFSELNFQVDSSRKPSLLQVGPGWREASTKITPIEDGKVPYQLPLSIHGFTKLNAFCRTKDNANEVHQSVYTDGLATVSVFIQKTNPNTAMPSAPLAHGAVMSKSEVQGTHLVTVLGEVPLQTLELFLKSVKWKSQ